MPTYTAPVKDMQFVLHEVLKVQDRADIEGYTDTFSEDMIGAILDESAKIAEQVYHPINQSGDEQGCRLEDGKVLVPDGFKEAYQAFCDGGWPALQCNPEFGGQGLPALAQLAVDEMKNSSNLGFAMYTGLTTAAIAAIDKWAAQDLREAYLPKMISGEWSGTMNLTESHCGTDLGLMRTKAEPQADGSYQVTGSKIFISAGEHEMTDNIIHLVLAKIPGGPKGIKGVSLFIVPKYLVNADGSLGEKNGVAVGSIEEKMGIHGNSTCVMNYDNAVGYLVGEENKGMRAMFTMMNVARVGVGVIGLCQSEIAYQNAVAYSNDRIQGRALTGAQFPDKAADPIIVHPDVRRMLMTARAFNEGARAAAFWLASVGDEIKLGTDAAAREKAEGLYELLTPVLKAYFTDKGFENAVWMQQCFGGHGYVKEWGMEQFVRDARIAQIYEGANGVQALDLVARQLPKKGGEAMRGYFAMLQTSIATAKGTDGLETFAGALGEAVADLQTATMWLMKNGMANPNNAGAASTDYLYICGLVFIGKAWLDSAIAAKAALASGTDDTAFYENKLTTARFFFERMIVYTSSHLRKLETGSDSMMALAADQF